VLGSYSRPVVEPSVSRQGTYDVTMNGPVLALPWGFLILIALGAAFSLLVELGDGNIVRATFAAITLIVIAMTYRLFRRQSP
jgi:hypothetical protein